MRRVAKALSNYLVESNPVLACKSKFVVIALLRYVRCVNSFVSTAAVVIAKLA
jgi:hypothetical protein